MQLVEPSNSLLRTELQPFDFANPPIDTAQLSMDLAKFMMDNNGIGLAANQVGLPYRVFVMRGTPILACFNPRIVDYSQEEIYLEEGCLTYPGLYVKIKRPKKIKCRYTMPNGETITQVFDGMTARVFQHELDHLNGIDFLSRATLYHREQAKKKLKNSK